MLIRCAGSGGYGDPLDREPARVLRDVRDGYISAEAALAHYGVVLSESGQDFDAAATQALRRQRRGQATERPGKRVSEAAE